jgi:uncharacterized membrane protein
MNTDRYIRMQRLIMLLAYGLHLLLLTSAMGALINAFKIRQYDKGTDTVERRRGTTALLASHHQWLLRTFLISLFFLAMGFGTLYYGVGYVLLFGAALWWVYRMLRGLVRYAENKPMPVA